MADRSGQIILRSWGQFFRFWVVLFPVLEDLTQSGEVLFGTGEVQDGERAVSGCHVVKSRHSDLVLETASGISPPTCKILFVSARILSPWDEVLGLSSTVLFRP